MLVCQEKEYLILQNGLKEPPPVSQRASEAH